MDKIVSRTYSEKGRKEHERIFGASPEKREDKLLVPGNQHDRGTFEAK